MDSAGGQFGLIDTESGNMVGWYESEEAALRDVAADVERFGPEAPDVLSLALFRTDLPGERGRIAAGPALVRRALAAAASPGA
jgi:hypothetical protein